MQPLSTICLIVSCKQKLVPLGDVLCSLGMLGLNTVIIVCHEELRLQFSNRQK